jgi:HEAT repeat protein
MTTDDTCSHVYLDKPIDHWLQYLEHPDPLFRRLGAHALSMIGPEGGAKATGALMVALDDSQSFVRIWAAAALAHVDPSQRRALDTLVAGLDDPQSFVRSLAAWQLGRLGPTLPGIEESVPRLQEMLQDDDPSARVEAEVALKAIQVDKSRASIS